MTTQKTFKPFLRHCRLCLCTDGNCLACVERTGAPCSWVERDLCSACQGLEEPVADPAAAPILRSVLEKMASAGDYLGSFQSDTILMQPGEVFSRYRRIEDELVAMGTYNPPLTWHAFVATVRSLESCTGLASYHESIVFAFSESKLNP